MAGLRIYHPELRSAIVQIPVPAKTAKGTAKVVNVLVDDNGYALVSEGVWDELQIAVDNGHLHQFMVMNEVVDPPSLELGTGGDGSRPTFLLEKEALREIVPAHVTTRVVEKMVPQNIRTR